MRAPGVCGSVQSTGVTQSCRTDCSVYPSWVSYDKQEEQGGIQNWQCSDLNRILAVGKEHGAGWLQAQWLGELGAVAAAVLNAGVTIYFCPECYHKC